MRGLVLFALLLSCLAAPSARAEEAAPSPAELRVTVIDQTGGALVTATVTVTDAGGVSRQVHVDGKGAVVITDLFAAAYHVKVEAEAFAPSEGTIALRKGVIAIVVRLPLAGVKEEVVVTENAEDVRGNAFTS